MCQMIDMIAPVDQHAITLDDLIKPNKMGYSGVLFDALFNLHKFMRFETRDPFQEKQKREDIFENDWDRFAHLEYHRLAAEEEENSYDSNNGTMEIEGDSKYQQEFSGGGSGTEWLIDDEDDDDLLMSSTSSASSSSNSNRNSGTGGMEMKKSQQQSYKSGR